MTTASENGKMRWRSAERRERGVAERKSHPALLSADRDVGSRFHRERKTKQHLLRSPEDDTDSPGANSMFRFSCSAPSRQTDGEEKPEKEDRDAVCSKHPSSPKGHELSYVQH